MIIGVEYETEIEHKSLQLSDRSSCVTDCVSGLLGQCECKQRQYAPVASASLTSCGHYGIIMLGHNMSCLSRVRTDNLTLLCVLYRPWITISDSHKWQGPRYVHPWQCQTRFDPRAFVRLVKVIVCPTIPAVVLVNCRVVSSVTIQYIVEQLIN